MSIVQLLIVQYLDAEVYLPFHIALPVNMWSIGENDGGGKIALFSFGVFTSSRYTSLMVPSLSSYYYPGTVLIFAKSGNSEMLGLSSVSTHGVFFSDIGIEP